MYMYEKYKVDMSELYRQMLRIRMIEEKLIELYNSGEVRSLMHLSTGQEAVAVGVCSALNREDSIVSTHRCHAHYLAKGGSFEEMLAELAGRQGGCVGGKGGSMHLIAPEVGVNLSVPLVAGSIPLAVGIAQSIKIKGNNRVSVAFFGDGAVEEGVFWESLNYAVVRKLPVLFVCENNLYATHAHITKRQPSADIAPRIQSFGLPCNVVDGNNVLDVQIAAHIGVEYIRDKGPVFIEAKTYRWKEHWGSGEDWHLGYRTKEECDIWKSRCPVQRLRSHLEKDGVLKETFEQIAKTITNEINEVVTLVKQSPEPNPEELLTWGTIHA